MVVLDRELFRFESKQHWIDKAQSWFQTALHRDHISHDFLCLDQKGRVCAWGAHFDRAERDGAFPVIVYAIDPPPEGDP